MKQYRLTKRVVDFNGAVYEPQDIWCDSTYTVVNDTGFSTRGVSPD